MCVEWACAYICVTRICMIYKYITCSHYIEWSVHRYLASFTKLCACYSWKMLNSFTWTCCVLNGENISCTHKHNIEKCMAQRQTTRGASEFVCVCEFVLGRKRKAPPHNNNNIPWVKSTTVTTASTPTTPTNNHDKKECAHSQCLANGKKLT